MIIGSKGYIGSRLMKDHSNMYEIHGVDIGWFSGKAESFDYNLLEEDFVKLFDVIILLAGHSSVKMCDNNMKSAFNNNVRNFSNLLSKMHKGQKLIYASSSSVYGMVGASAVDESYDKFVPHNDYDVTKHCVDLLAARSNIEYYGLRFGTVNGYSPRVRNDVMINSMTYSAVKTGTIQLYIKDIVRPILGLNDLSRGIKKIIDTDKDCRGIYNMASFSDTAEGIAKSVSSVTGVGITYSEVDPKNITNGKLQTVCYDFDIDSTKFSQTFNFTFSDTAESLTSELLQNFDDIEFSNRNININYE